MSHTKQPFSSCVQFALWALAIFFAKPKDSERNFVHFDATDVLNLCNCITTRMIQYIFTIVTYLHHLHNRQADISRSCVICMTAWAAVGFKTRELLSSFCLSSSQCVGSTGPAWWKRRARSGNGTLCANHFGTAIGPDVNKFLPVVH